MAKNYSSSDSETDLFITQNTFINDNYNLDISENDRFLFRAAQGLQTISIISTKTSRFVHQNVLKKVHSVVRIYCLNNRVTSLIKESTLFGHSP